MSDVIVNGPVLEQDAEKIWQAWQAGSDKLVAMKGGIPELDSNYFSWIPGAQEAAGLYAKAREAMGDYIAGGASEFLTFEHLLLRTVLAYAQAHDASVDDIKRLQKELGT